MSKFLMLKLHDNSDAIVNIDNIVAILLTHGPNPHKCLVYVNGIKPDGQTYRLLVNNSVKTVSFELYDQIVALPPDLNPIFADVQLDMAIKDDEANYPDDDDDEDIDYDDGEGLSEEEKEGLSMAENHG